MGFNPAVLFKAPQVNPITKKARSIPILNPFNVYGRVFFFSWWGFMVAFLSWYAWSPLIGETIKADLKLTQAQIANSNILALVATLLVRCIAGPLCDKFGPRLVFAGVLLAGAVPTAFAFAIKNAAGLIVLRFFVGILGGSFVPCQVWSTGFFDKNIVGTANSITGGFGNAGGGITYFVMPAIFDTFVNHYGMTKHKAWRMAFFVPFGMIVGTAILMLLLTPDTPVGKWKDRHAAVEANLRAEHEAGRIIPHTGLGEAHHAHGPPLVLDDKKNDSTSDVEHGTGEVVAVDTEYSHEVVMSPTFKEIVQIALSPQTLTLMACYFCSFGAELAINSILGAYYLKNFPKLGQSGSGDWAAMFGLLNVVFRPMGGMMSDALYKFTGGKVWSKKILVHVMGVLMGMFMIIIGATDSHNRSTMVGLIAGLAFFLEAGNGANFGLVPHVHPYANGVVSGFTGASGNLGGIIGAIIFRYNGLHYGKSIWIFGIIAIVLNLAVCWIRPVPKGQIGGR
ncbi:nitrate transporter [Microthyrium microscopicum]|uniref:Nitrate/nitrite transporter n=1 Tax=Microthyrium microscopicum TaxID=703497 RepID=A0A6A6U2M0_9PEZI|nr:nitrate transporter [Microthyrium microscopicum]